MLHDVQRCCESCSVQLVSCTVGWVGACMCMALMKSTADNHFCMACYSCTHTCHCVVDAWLQGIESLTDIAEVTLERAATAPMPPAGTSGMGRSLQQSVPNPAIYALPIIPSTSSSSTTTSPKPYSRGRAQSDNVASINPANEFRQLMQESRQRANSAVDDSSSSIADVSKPSSSGWFSRR